MQFFNPIWLWGFSGLLIPVAIHLLSRKEGKVIRIGSIRFLRESATAKFSHIKLNERMLLVLRCIIIALLVSLLAGLRVDDLFKGKRMLVLLDGDLLTNPSVSAIADSLEAEGFEVRMLRAGFPMITDTTDTPDPEESYWALAESLTTIAADSIVVFSANYLRNFAGSKTGLPAHVHWVGVEPEPRQFTAMSIIKGNTIWERAGRSDRMVTSFETILKDGIKSRAGASAQEIKISIFTDSDFVYDGKVVRAALEAIQAVTPHTIQITSVTNGQIDTTGWLFWLSRKPIPAFSEERIFSYRDCNAENIGLLITSDKARFICEHPLQSRWIITKRLNEEVAVEEDFAVNLAAAILPAARIEHTNDVRVLPEKMLWSGQDASKQLPVPAGDQDATNRLLVLFLVATVLTERLLSFKRNQ